MKRKLIKRIIASIMLLVVFMSVGCSKTTPANSNKETTGEITTDTVEVTTEEEKEEVDENLNYAMEEIQATYKAETDLLKQYPNIVKGDAIEILYDFESEEYQELLDKYPIEEIAGEGSEFERVERLLYEFSARLIHGSYYDNSIEETALALLEYSLDKPENGINCRAKAVIFKDMCLALGIYARIVSIAPYSAVDMDSHVVNEIYDSKLQKWIMVDLTTGGYVVDKNNIPLSVLEIRQCGIEGKDCQFVCKDYTASPEQYNKGLGDILTYYMKNVFYFAISTHQGYGDFENESQTYFYIPENFDIKKQMLSNYNYEIQLFKEMSEYAHLAELLEKDMEELRKATFEIGDVESVYVPLKSE